MFYKFDRSYETMTSKERVNRTFNFEKSDRVPINYFANPTIHAKFAKSLGVDDGNYEKVLDILGVDFRGIGAGYKGPLLFKEIGGLSVDPVYGFYTKTIYNESGYYHDFCNFPLKDADDDIIANFPVPDPDDFDYSNIESALDYYKGKAVHIGGAGIADIINSTGRVMGMEETLVRFLTQDEATLCYLDRRLNMELGMLERIMEKAGGKNNKNNKNNKVDFLWMGEDLGTQIAPMISLDLYRKVFRPRHQKFIDLAKSYDLPVMIHTCGSSSWAYNDFIEMGINAVDTLQPEATNMNPLYLKENFGGKLCFHGGISTVSTLTDGSAGEVGDTVRETIEIFRDLNCYMLSPTHMIQDNTPVENVTMMYEAAHKYGRY